MQLREYFETPDAISQAALARAVGVTSGMVWQWVHGVRRIAGENVLAIEAATGGRVTRYALRPDLYPCDVSHSAEAAPGALLNAPNREEAL